MEILQIKAFNNNAHDNRIIDSKDEIPDGWCVVPNDVQPLENFPYGLVTVKDGTAPNGAPCKVLDEWTGLEPPPPPEPEPEPEPEASELDKVKAQALYTAVMTDTLLEEEETEE